MRFIGTRPYSRPVPVPKMPAGLVELMEGLTRDVLMNNPPDIYEFCAGHMNKLLEIRDGPNKKVALSLEEKIARAQKKVKQKAETRYLKYLKEVQNSNNNGEKSNNHGEKLVPVTPPLQNMLKLPVHQDLNLSNASEIEIAHGIGAVISSPNQNIQYKIGLTDEIEPEKIPKERAWKTDKQDIEMDVTTLNKIASCDTMVEADESSSISENFKNLKSKNENVDVKFNKVQFEPNECSKNLTPAEDSADSKISNENDNEQFWQNNNEKNNFVANLIFDGENSKVKIKNEMNLLNEVDEEKTSNMITSVPNNEETTEGEQIQNRVNDNQVETEKNVNSADLLITDVINEHKHKTDLQELSSNDLEKNKNFKETTKIITESNVGNMNDMIQLPIILEKNERHAETDTLELTVIDEKTHLYQEQTDETNFQPDADESDQNILNNMSDKKGKTTSIIEGNTIDEKQNEVQEYNLLTSSKDLKNNIKETPNSEVNIVDNHLLKDNESNTDTMRLSNEISSSENSIRNVNDVPNEFNPDGKITKDTKICLESMNDTTLDVTNTGEPKSKIVSNSDINKSRSIENPQETLSERLEISQNADLVSNHDMSSVNDVSKNTENESIAQSEKNVINFNIGDNKQRGIEHESSSQTDKIVTNLSEVNEQHRVKRDITETAYNQNDDTVFSKKSISGDESIDGNDNISFVESGASETPDDTSQRTNPNSNGMDLETAAVTIQKVFRTFLFKSRASTFDDANEENMPLDDDSDKKEEIEFQATNVNSSKERRGISRMDTVLQTVNEEKSLSLSTDDSSTLSSAATTIQAHVRGFLVRNKLHSHKTASTSSLVNSDGPSNTSLEGDTELNKNKTILNIHIVPEGGNYLSRDESMLTSMDFSLDGSPPSSLNLHPLGYDRNERRKQLKREDAIQSISPPSNNSGKLSEDVDSVKDVLINDGEVTLNEKILNTDEVANSDNPQLQPRSGDTSPTNSTTIETVVEAHRAVDLEASDSKMEVQENSTKRTLTKMSSDEMDVVTPFEDNPENESSTESHNTSKLMHSGEFHDIVLPTKVSRKDTSVVSEFKNVLVYFLLWNNSL